jgi:hypothetical protein
MRVRVRSYFISAPRLKRIGSFGETKQHQISEKIEEFKFK